MQGKSRVTSMGSFQGGYLPRAREWSAHTAELPGTSTPLEIVNAKVHGGPQNR